MKIYRAIFVFILLALSTAVPSQGALRAASDEKVEPLAEFLAGTKWFWEGSKGHILEFRKDGTVNLDYWTLPTDWKVTGPNQVTFTMHFKTEDNTSTITFNHDRSSFTGIRFRGGAILKSPRAPGDDARNQ